MYWLFIRLGILPGAYHNLPEGDKVVIRAFMDHYIEEAHG
jgi:hypothetical protein